MDDLGYGDISNFGAINYKTPNIDKMANQGMLFTNFYSAQAVCSASRAGLLTGTYPNRIGISGALMPYSRKGLHKDEITIAERGKITSRFPRKFLTLPNLQYFYTCTNRVPIAHWLS